MLTLILSSCQAERAEAIAEVLLNAHLAACVSILPGAVSIYRWQGKIQRDREALLLIKTPTDTVKACVEKLRAVHPYSVPEIVQIAASDVSASYLQWAIGETRAQ